MPLCWLLAATAYGKVCEGSGYERSRRLRRYAALLASFFVLTVVGVPGQLSAQTVEGTYLYTCRLVRFFLYQHVL